MDTAVAELHTYPIQPVASPTTLSVFCADPRFDGPTRQFLHEELKIPDGGFVPMQIAGGAASFSLLELPKELKYVREAVRFYLGLFRSITRVIVISHEDCGKYRALQQALPHLLSLVPTMTDRQRADLQKASDAILALAPRQLTIERYYARFANPEHTQVRFEKL